MNWPLPLELHQLLRVFSAAPLCKSFAANGKWSLDTVSRRGRPVIGRVLCF